MLYQTHTPSAMNDVLTFYLYLAFSRVLQNAGILNCTPKAIKISNEKEDQTEKLEWDSVERISPVTIKRTLVTCPPMWNMAVPPSSCNPYLNPLSLHFNGHFPGEPRLDGVY